MVGLIPATPHAGLMRRYGATGPNLIATLRAELTDEIRNLDHAAIEQTVRDALVEHGGTFIPVDANGWGPHEAQLDLLGISGTGATLIDAIADWAKAARRTALASEEAA